MTPITRALFSAIHCQALNNRANDKPGLVSLEKEGGLRDAFLDAPEGTLYIELDPGSVEARALWFELLEAGAKPPMTAITPGDGNGVVVLLFPEGIELYIQSDNPEEGTLTAQLSPEPGKEATWTFQRG